MFKFSNKKMIFIPQVESTECGLACIAMISAYFGNDIGLNKLRQSFPVSMKGSNLSAIVSCAQAVGFDARPLRVDLGALKTLAVPAILHWNLNHFVVLVKYRRGIITIIDPAVGFVSIRLEDASKHFTGIAVEFHQNKNFIKNNRAERINLKEIILSQPDIVGRVGIILSFTLIVEVMAVTSPLILQLMFDSAISDHEVSLIIGLSILLMLNTLIFSLVDFLRARLVVVISNAISLNLMGIIMNKIISLSIQWFERRQVGATINRMDSINIIRSFITESIVALTVDSSIVLWSGIFLYLYSWRAALVIIAGCMANGLMTKIYIKKQKSAQLSSVLASSSERSYVIETIQAIRVIKLSGSTAQRFNKWRSLFIDTQNAVSYSTLINSTSASVKTFINGLQLVFTILLLTAWGEKGNSPSIGVLFAILAYRELINGRFSSVLQVLTESRVLGVHLDRLGDILLEPADQTGSDFKYKNFDFGRIVIKDLHFQYGLTDPPTISCINLSVDAREMVGIIGPTGSGKSTLLKLMMGLYKPTSGSIIVDGSSIHEENISNWWTRIGCVMQDDTLLAGTIADNVAFFDPEIDVERLEAACRSASIHDEIMRFPMNYFSLVGDMGSSLSGGQKQRILLARALYKRPAVLFLDEGTANLDAVSEIKVSDMIKSLNMTRVIVAHRPELIKRCDRIYKITSGFLNPISLTKAMDWMDGNQC